VAQRYSALECEEHHRDHVERFYEQTADGAAKAAREICDLLRVGPSRLMNARENMRDAAHYVREMQHYDRVVAENGSLLNGLIRVSLEPLPKGHRQLFRCPKGVAYMQALEIKTLL
jgi:hypothetical protein